MSAGLEAGHESGRDVGRDVGRDADRDAIGNARTLKFITPAGDGWTVAPHDEPITPRAGLVLSLAQWLELRAQWPQQFAVGVALPNDAELAPIVADLPRLALIVLDFPKWTDGRAYSQARVLRVRHRFAGELRAGGQVIADMAAQLFRTGFDAVALREGESTEVAQRMLSRFSAFYQADIRQPLARFARPTPEQTCGEFLPAASGTA